MESLRQHKLKRTRIFEQKQNENLYEKQTEGIGKDDKKLALRSRIRHCLAYFYRRAEWGGEPKRSPP